MSRALITLNDIQDGGIGEAAIEQSVTQKRIKFDPNFEFNRNGSYVDGKSLTLTLPVGAGPQYITFDGSHLWVTTQSNGVLKIDPHTNATVATGLASVSALRQVTFDGEYIWVCSPSDATIYKLNPLDATTLGSVAIGGLGTNGGGMARATVPADSDDLWVCRPGAQNILRVTRTGTPTVAQIVTLMTGSPGFNEGVNDVVYDGTHLWATVANDAKIRTILPLNGRTTTSVPVDPTGVDITVGTPGADFPRSITFDGQNIWVVVTSFGGAAIKKYSLTGTPLAVFGIASFGVLTFNGNYLLVTNTSSNTVQVISPLAISVQRTFTTGTSPQGIVSDGSYIWTADSSGGTLTRTLL